MFVCVWACMYRERLEKDGGCHSVPLRYGLSLHLELGHWSSCLHRTGVAAVWSHACFFNMGSGDLKNAFIYFTYICLDMICVHVSMCLCVCWGMCSPWHACGGQRTLGY